MCEWVDEDECDCMHEWVVKSMRGVPTLTCTHMRNSMQEIQSEYWQLQGITLLINITMFWRGDKIIHEVNVYCTGDKSHDTWAWQHAMKQWTSRYQNHPDTAECTFHHVGSDGAPSHFKNKYSLDFLRELKSMWIGVQWGFNAPSHGKGPWDGIGAVVKTLLRRMELLPSFPGHRYCETWADVWIFLTGYYTRTTTLHDARDVELIICVKNLSDKRVFETGVNQNFAQCGKLIGDIRFAYRENHATTTVSVDLRYDDTASATAAIAKASATNLNIVTGFDVESVTVQDHRWWGECKKHLHNGIVSKMIFHYIMPPPDTMSEKEKVQWSAQGEATKHAAMVKCEGHEVMEPVDRSSKFTANVPAIDGIKSDYFCVMALHDDSLGLRKFSCFCGPCLAAGQNCWRTFAVCENLDTCGPWVVVKMTDDGVELSNLHRILREEAERTFWPDRWHDECGLEGAPCARGCTEPGDTLLQCTYCPGAFHMDCVGLGNRKRHKGEWACPACIKAAIEIAEGEENGVGTEIVDTSDTGSPEDVVVAIEIVEGEENGVRTEIVDMSDTDSLEDVTGRVVIIKETGYPAKSEHAFVFAWVRSVSGHRLEVMEYSQSTDLCGELVDGTEPEWVDRTRVISDSFTYRLTSRLSRRCSEIKTTPLYKTPPRRLYISRQTYNHISTIVEESEDI